MSFWQGVFLGYILADSKDSKPGCLGYFLALCMAMLVISIVLLGIEWAWMEFVDWFYQLIGYTPKT